MAMDSLGLLVSYDVSIFTVSLKSSQSKSAKDFLEEVEPVTVFFWSLGGSRKKL